MALATFINSSYYGSEEEYSDLADFHTYTGKDVWVWNDYTVLDFDYDSLKADLEHFLDCCNENYSKISENLREDIVPILIMDNGNIEVFKDINSFKNKLQQSIPDTIVDVYDDRIANYVEIVLNDDKTVSIIITDKENSNSKSIETFGYILKSDSEQLIEEHKKHHFTYFDACMFYIEKEMFDNINISKLYYDNNNSYYDLLTNIEILNHNKYYQKDGDEIISDYKTWEIEEDIPF